VKVKIQKPEILKWGDLIVIDYGKQSEYKVFLSKIERVLPDGGIIVGKGGHAHRVEFEDILCQCVGANATNAREKGAYITFKERIAEGLENNKAIEFETFTQWYERKYQND
jgi:hypothetical protein